MLAPNRPRASEPRLNFETPDFSSRTRGVLLPMRAMGQERTAVKIRESRWR